MLRPIADEPIAIRQAIETGWRGFRHHASVLVGFTVLLGGLNLTSWLVYRSSGGLLDGGVPQASILQLSEALAALLAYLLSGAWLLVGLIRGADRALEGHAPSLGELLRFDALAVARLAWSLLVLLLLLALVQQSGEVSAALLALLLPRLAELPPWAARAVVVYVLGNQSGLAAFRSGRRATDPHWLQALGLLLVVALMLLGGFVLLVAMAAALPWALCTLTAAYRQLFVMPTAATARWDRH